MGEVVSLAVERERRSAVLRVAAERAASHPALRWLAGSDTSRAHLRVPEVRPGQPARPRCGAEGRLTVAGRSVPLCPECYAPAAAE